MSDEKVQVLYGSTIPKERACAYCRRHCRHMTVKQVKKHECLKKQCWYLVKNEEHEWWHQRELTKQRRIARKNKNNL